jgi:type I restriction enzyme, S subunit
MVPIGELKAPTRYSLVGGPFGSKLGRRDYVKSGVPVIRGANLPADRIFSFDDFVFVTDEKADDLAGNLAYPGDIVVTQRGTLGQVGLIPSPSPYKRFVVSQSQMKLTVDPSVADARFVYYALGSPDSVQRIHNMALVAGVPHINLGLFEGFEVPLPDLEVQQKIAAVLSAYDELIDNNTRRIQILEQMAQAIYREWFVCFRYPSHEDVPLVNSDLGQVPEGWPIVSIYDVAEVIRGRSYSKSEILESGGVPFLNLKCINRGGGFRRSGLKRYAGPYKSAQEVRPTEIVVAVTDMTQERNVVARAARVPSLWNDFGVISLDLVKVVPTAVCSPYLYGLLGYSSFPHEVKNFANGANVLHLHPDRIGEYRFPCAPPKLQLRYSEVVDPMYDLADRLELQVEILRITRDLLVPRLVSGEIDVSKLHLDGVVESL